MMANGRVSEAAVSVSLAIWSDLSWIAVPLLTLVLAAAIGSLVFFCCEKRKRYKVGVEYPNAKVFIVLIARLGIY